MLMVVTDPPEVVIVAAAAAPLPEPVSENVTVGAEVYPEPKVSKTTLWIATVAVAAARVAPGIGSEAVPLWMVMRGAVEYPDPAVSTTTAVMAPLASMSACPVAWRQL